jgi:excisionase family DNA binding protein
MRRIATPPRREPKSDPLKRAGISACITRSLKKLMSPILRDASLKFVCFRHSTPARSVASIDFELCRTQMGTSPTERAMRSDRPRKIIAQNGSTATPIQDVRRDRDIPFAQRLTCTIAEACTATGLGRTKLYELIAAGNIATTTVGRRRLVLVRSLQCFLDPDTSNASSP